jgi:NADPH:quinone reductase-like Zn-dependent oxidoreductase
MKQAQVAEFGQSPKYVDVEDPPVPGPDSELVQVKVLAAGLPRIVKMRAEGKHYSAKGLPHIPGVDGVGKTADGKLVYFSTMTPLGGSFQEIVNVPKATIIEVPEGADPIQIAGLVNPGMSSWQAVKYRTKDLPPNYKVVILGATTTSGGLAIELQRQLGAGKIIGVARSVAKLQSLGLDDYIELKEPAEETDFSKASDADLILDYLWGPPALTLLKSLPAFTKPFQWVQIGSLSALEVSFPGDLLRSKNVVFTGSGPGSFTIPQLSEGMKSLIQEGLVKVKPHPFKVVKLEDIEKAWSEQGDRIVVVP